MQVSSGSARTFARSMDCVKAQDFHFAFRFGMMRAPSSCGRDPKLNGSKKRHHKVLTVLKNLV
jgi:hypothetical protein